MDFFPWDNSYEIGIAKIDEQHKKLVQMVDRLYGSMKDGKAAELVGGLVNELGDYTLYHFNEEERLMKQAGYAGLDEHKREHAEFIEYVKSQKQKIDAGKQMLIGYDLAKFLKNWLQNHITGTDKKYGPDLRNAGIK